MPDTYAEQYAASFRARDADNPPGRASDYSDRVQYLGGGHWRIWPCDRRDAHGPHAPTIRFAPGMGTRTIDCAGVLAHPSTMAGNDGTVRDVHTCPGCPLSCGNCGA